MKIDEITNPEVQDLINKMIDVGNYIDDICNWISNNISKARVGLSGWEFGATQGVLGFGIARFLGQREYEKEIYRGLNFESMSMDIIEQVKKLVDYQLRVQEIVDIDDPLYFNLVNYIIRYGHKYEINWLSFNAKFVDQRVELDGKKMKYWEMIQKLWVREVLRLDLEEETKSSLYKTAYGESR